MDDMNINKPIQQRIVLFGPTQSGKDWLVRGFAKEVEQINLNSSLSFHYRLEEIISPDGKERRPAEVFPPENIPGTQQAVDFPYALSRKPKNDKDKRFQATHNILVHNDRGDNFINALLYPETDEYKQLVSLIDTTRNFIVVVGPPETEPLNYRSQHLEVPEDDLPRNPFAQPQEQERNMFDASPKYDVSRFTVSKYERFIRELLSRLRNKEPKRNVAICMTKADLDGLMLRDPEEYFFSTFSNLKGDIASFIHDGHKLKIFRSSAAGMLENIDLQGRRIEEPNIEGGRLKDSNNWKPQGNARPFFWICQTIEKEAIQKKPEGIKGLFNCLLKDKVIYPPYPGLCQED